MMIQVFKAVFSNFRYVKLAVFASFIVFSGVMLFPNLSLINTVTSSNVINFAEKTKFLFSLYGAIATNFTVFSATYTIAISILFGINLALLVYYIRRVKSVKTSNKKIHLAGIGGMISGLLGIGCVACGSLILTGVLAMVGAGGLLLYLPLRGAEFGILGVLLLLVSIYLVSKKINDPLVCLS